MHKVLFLCMANVILIAHFSRKKTYPLWNADATQNHEIFLMTFKAVIFDLDGTLLDTLQDIVNTLNTVLAQHHYPVHTIDECRFLVGHGMRELVKKALPDEAGTPETIDLLLKDLMTHYADNWNRHSRPYPGISTLLDTLSERGIKKAILSNKADHFTRLCAEVSAEGVEFRRCNGPSQRHCPQTRS